jgi:glycosyl transferase family 25
VSLRIYFINLDAETDRRIFMEAQLAGQDFERVSSVQAVGVSEPYAKLRPVERACMQSHREAWRRFLASEALAGCFLEDDVHLTQNFFALAANMDWIPSGAHAVKLDSYFQRIMLSDRRDLAPGVELAVLETLHESSAGYILSRAGAEAYLKITEEPSEPVDRVLFPDESPAKGLLVFQVIPAVLLQDHLLSDRAPHKRRFSTVVQDERLNKVRRKLNAAQRSRKIKREAARIVSQAARFIRAAHRRMARGMNWEVVGFDESALPPADARASNET